MAGLTALGMNLSRENVFMNCKIRSNSSCVGMYYFGLSTLDTEATALVVLLAMTLEALYGATGSVTNKAMRSKWTVTLFLFLLELSKL